MLWLIVAIAAIWMAAVSPAFRKFLLCALLFCSAAIFILWLWFQNQERERAGEDAAAKRRIPIQNVELVDLRMSAQHSMPRLTGRVRNNDKGHALTAVELRLIIRDCATPGRCDTVGETVESISMQVPPGQARDVDEMVHFSGLRQGGVGRDWTFSVVSVSGK
jgi:hypothetical protein